MLVAYLIVTAILIRTFITFYEIPSTALSAELSPNYDERTRLISYRFLFGWIGGLAMYALALLVFLKPEAGSVGQLNADGYRNYGLCAAVLMLAAILVSALATHHRIPTLPRPAREPILLRRLTGQMLGTLSHRTFLFILGASFFNAMALGLAFSINLYFVTYFWQFSAPQIALLGASSLIVAVIAFWAAPRVSAGANKRTATVVLILAGAIVTVAPVSLRLAGLFPGNGTAILYWLVFAANVIGLGFGITGQIQSNSMIADVVEDSELRTGRRQEGLFFAAAAFVNKDRDRCRHLCHQRHRRCRRLPAGSRAGQGRRGRVAEPGAGLCWLDRCALLRRRPASAWLPHHLGKPPPHAGAAGGTA